MAFNINKLKANIENEGYLKTNAFEVIITPPPVLQNRAINNLGTSTSINLITSNLRFRIDRLTAPGVALVCSDISRYGVGPTQRIPFSAQYQEISFSVLCDGFGDIWQFWHNWLKSIYDFNGSDSSRVGDANSFASYLTEYKSRYSTNMQILIYDMYGNTINRVNILEAFPTSIREIGLNWGDSSNLMRLSISIAYTEHTLVGSTLEDTITPQRRNIRYNIRREGNSISV